MPGIEALPSQHKLFIQLAAAIHIARLVIQQRTSLIKRCRSDDFANCDFMIPCIGVMTHLTIKLSQTFR